MNNIMHLFTKLPRLSSERYNLRPLKASDDQAIYDIYSDNETLKYQGMATLPSVAAAKDYIKKIQQGYETSVFIRWAIACKTTDRVVGLIALHHLDEKQESAGIGYILNKKYWQQHIMSDHLKLVLDYLENHIQIQHLSAQIHPENTASIRLAEKMGFKQIKKESKAVLNPSTGRYEDRLILEKLMDKQETKES